MILAFLFACGSEPAAPRAAEAPAPAPASHEATPHTHTAPHGGDVKTAGSVHLEAKFMPDGVLVWVSDKDEKPLDTSAFAGATAVVKGEGAPQSVTMTPMGEHLHAQVPLENGKPASAVVTLVVDGKPESVSFSTTAVGMAEHEHTALHGGAVSMWGDYHVEYAPKDDEYRFFVSDAKRQTVTAGVSGAVKDGETTLPLEFDATTGLLHAKAEGAGTRPVTLDAKVGETAFTLGFPAAGGGHAHEGGEHAHEGGEHAH
jgi:hypothetical protein